MVNVCPCNHAFPFQQTCMSHNITALLLNQFKTIQVTSKICKNFNLVEGWKNRSIIIGLGGGGGGGGIFSPFSIAKQFFVDLFLFRFVCLFVGCFLLPHFVVLLLRQYPKAGLYVYGLFAVCMPTFLQILDLTLFQILNPIQTN